LIRCKPISLGCKSSSEAGEPVGALEAGGKLPPSAFQGLNAGEPARCLDFDLTESPIRTIEAMLMSPVARANQPASDTTGGATIARSSGGVAAMRRW